MNYIVLDMEWNQPIRKTARVEGLRGEIIRIGAVRLGTGETFSCSVTPQYYKAIHYGVAKITGLKQGDLSKGEAFPKAFARFSKWCGTDFAFLTWGPDDIYMLNDNLTVYGLNPDWVPPSYNIQNLFDEQVTKEGRVHTLTTALELVGETHPNAHDALGDALGTAILCKYMDLEKGLVNYPAIGQPTPQKPKKRKTVYLPELLKTFCAEKGITKYPNFRESCTFACSCGKTHFVRYWKPRNGPRHYGAVMRCECGAETELRIRYRKTLTGTLCLQRRSFKKAEEKGRRKNRREA